jgi:hypothetical protein
MAKITFIWDGKTGTPTEFSTDYYKGPTSGYFRASGSNEEWTGLNLTYFLTDSYLPTAGTLTSWSNVQKSGVWSMSITDLNLVIPKNSTYEILINEMIKGKDDWYGNDLNNFFYISVGGDTYHGGGGIDTINAVTNKSLWVSSATKYAKLANGNIQISNFGSTSITLDSIERLKFADSSIAFDIDGNAGKVAKVLGAVFGKNSLTNKDYVGIGLNFLDAGMDYKNLLDLALTAKLGQSYTSESAIKLLYTNVFNLTPGTSTLDVLKGLVDSGYCSKSELAYIIAETSNNQTNVNLVGLAQNGIEYIPFAG